VSPQLAAALAELARVMRTPGLRVDARLAATIERVLRAGRAAQR
jgi:hypothetical protein